jgi:hypothetical protein
MTRTIVHLLCLLGSTSLLSCADDESSGVTGGGEGGGSSSSGATTGTGSAAASSATSTTTGSASSTTTGSATSTTTGSAASTTTGGDGGGGRDGAGGTGGDTGTGGASTGSGGAAGVGELLGTSDGATFKHLDVDGADVFVSSGEAIWRLPTTGGAVVEVTANPSSFTHIDADGGFVYFLHVGLERPLRRVPVGGGAVTDLTPAMPLGRSLDVDGSTVFFSRFDGAGEVSTTGSDYLVYEFAATSFGAIAGFGGFAYYGQSNYSETWRVPVGGGEPELVDDRVAVEHLVDDGVTLFYASRGAAEVGRIDGLDLIPIASGIEEPLAIGTDGAHVYWLDREADEIARAPVGGGPSEVVVPAPAGAEDMVVTPSHVYWTTRSQVFRLAL